MYSDSLANSMRRQFNIVFALVVREMTTRYGNKFGGYMWAVLDPVLFIAIMTSVFSAVAHTPPLGRSFTMFFATGYSAFYLYRSMADQVSSSIQANRALLNYPVLNLYDTIIARFSLQIVTLFVVNLVIFIALYLMYRYDGVRVDRVLTASVIAISLGAGVGICNIVWFHLSSLYQQVWNIINRPAFIISGVFFLPESVPHPFREYLMWNPLVHIIALFRSGFYPTYRAAFLNMNYIIGLSVFTLAFGMCLVWIFDAKLREQK